MHAPAKLNLRGAPSGTKPNMHTSASSKPNMKGAPNSKPNLHAPVDEIEETVADECVDEEVDEDAPEDAVGGGGGADASYDDDGFEDDGIEDDGIEDEETPAPALPSPAVPSPSAPASPAAKTAPSHGTPPTPPAAVSDEKRPPKKAALGGDGRAEKPWSAHAPAGGRATVGSYAQPDPATAGYYERPASSLIQMLLSTRARRRQIRSQMRTERESQALKAEAAEHLQRLSRRPGSAGPPSRRGNSSVVSIGGSRPSWLDNVNQTIVLPDGSVRVRAASPPLI